MDDIRNAYHLVLNDILEHGPNMFRGIYDAKNGKASFMDGIQTVMEYIAINDSDIVYEQFSDVFTKNVVKSKDKAGQTELD